MVGQVADRCRDSGWEWPASSTFRREAGLEVKGGEVLLDVGTPGGAHRGPFRVTDLVVGHLAGQGPLYGGAVEARVRVPRTSSSRPAWPLTRPITSDLPGTAAPRVLAVRVHCDSGVYDDAAREELLDLWTRTTRCSRTGWVDRSRCASTCGSTPTAPGKA